MYIINILYWFVLVLIFIFIFSKTVLQIMGNIPPKDTRKIHKGLIVCVLTDLLLLCTASGIALDTSVSDTKYNTSSYQKCYYPESEKLLTAYTYLSNNHIIKLPILDDCANLIYVVYLHSYTITQNKVSLSDVSKDRIITEITNMPDTCRSKYVNNLYQEYQNDTLKLLQTTTEPVYYDITGVAYVALFYFLFYVLCGITFMTACNRVGNCIRKRVYNYKERMNSEYAKYND